MSIEQGFEQLIQGQLGTPPIAPGGFGVQLPPDFITPSTPMAYTISVITSTPNYVLEGEDLLTEALIQIDCHGYAMVNAIALAMAIISGIRAAQPPSGSNRLVLQDPDQTVVQGIFRRPRLVDGYSDTNHTFVRSLEYLVTYYDQP